MFCPRTTPERTIAEIPSDIVGLGRATAAALAPLAKLLTADVMASKTAVPAAHELDPAQFNTVETIARDVLLVGARAALFWVWPEPVELAELTPAPRRQRYRVDRAAVLMCHNMVIASQSGQQPI